MKLLGTGSANGVKAGRLTSSSRDRLIYVLTCFVGHRVEVHVKNGSIISGIFHATNADGDFGTYPYLVYACMYWKCVVHVVWLYSPPPSLPYSCDPVVHYLVGQSVSSIGFVSSPFCFYNNCLKLVADIVLKMAQVVKDGSVREQKSVHDTIKMPQQMIIPARELVQVLAKVYLDLLFHILLGFN